MNPNPFVEVLHIPVESEQGFWELINMRGETVAKGLGNTISGTQLESGVYLLKYGGAKGKVKTALTFRKND